jgi:GH35 family endo-1,4-beta-xylanase
MEDGPNGVGDGTGGVTAIPDGESAAATWDPALIQQEGTAMGAEFAAIGQQEDHRMIPDGLTTAEINLPWNTIEPKRGTFSFNELDQELANASAARIRLVLIFWYSVGRGSPASWVTSHEVFSSGAQDRAPAWWDPAAEPAYITYVTDTVKHVADEAGYGGTRPFRPA